MTIPDDPSTIAPQANPPAKPLQRAVVILLLAIVVVIGAVIFMMSRRTGPATDQAKAFIQDMVNGKLEAAKSRCTSDVDFDTMARTSGKMKFWGALEQQSFIERLNGERADVDGTLNFEKTPKAFQATLKKQSDGKFLISAYSFN